MIKIAVVEDEKSSQKLLKELLNRYSEEKAEPLDLVFFDNGVDFLENFKAEYDIVFMDIEMPFMNGMETARKMREMDADICLIFITNMANYAISGYEVEAFYFLVKPVQYLNFSAKLERAIRLKQNSNSKVSVNTKDGLKIIKTADIFYIEVVNNLVTYHTALGNFQEKNSLKNVENIVCEGDKPNSNFVKCNSCFLVNLKYLTNIKDNIAIVNGENLQISRNRKKEFVNTVTKYLGGR